MRIGLMLSKHEGLPLVSRMVHWLEEKNVDVCIAEELAAAIQYEGAGTKMETFFQGLDLAMVFGGDGTILQAAGWAAPYNVPLLGVNYGKLGFLPEVQPEELEETVIAFLNGKGFYEDRIMLKATLPNGSAHYALNDLTIVRRPDDGILRARVLVNSEYLDTFSADGVLISTPTGSTAYALSCGGPVIAPGIDCMLLLAICPHSLRTRPVILPPDACITVELTSRNALVLMDGKTVDALDKDHQVDICIAQHKTRFLRIKHRNYFSLLNSKLSEWSS